VLGRRGHDAQRRDRQRPDLISRESAPGRKLREDAAEKVPA